MKFEVGQMVKCGKYKCKVFDISCEPFIEFDDGSKHYGIDIVREDGVPLYVNDAQIEAIEQNGN